jgi:hypothetical protein
VKESVAGATATAVQGVVLTVNNAGVPAWLTNRGRGAEALATAVVLTGARLMLTVAAPELTFPGPANLT